MNIRNYEYRRYTKMSKRQKWIIYKRDKCQVWTMSKMSKRQSGIWLAREKCPSDKNPPTKKLHSDKLTVNV